MGLDGGGTPPSSDDRLADRGLAFQEGDSLAG